MNNTKILSNQKVTLKFREIGFLMLTKQLSLPKLIWNEVARQTKEEIHIRISNETLPKDQLLTLQPVCPWGKETTIEKIDIWGTIISDW